VASHSLDPTNLEGSIPRRPRSGSGRVDANVQAKLAGLTITGGSVSGFDLSGFGGGILNNGGVMSVTHSTISGNSAL
jgi:hypothetical protein